MSRRAVSEEHLVINAHLLLVTACIASIGECFYLVTQRQSPFSDVIGAEKAEGAYAPLSLISDRDVDLVRAQRPCGFVFLGREWGKGGLCQKTYMLLI